MDPQPPALHAPPAVSVLLPVWNGEAYLRRCIESVLEQTFGDFELLIGDDGSTDSSGAIAQAFPDPRLRYFPRGGRLGLFANLNQLIQDSRGARLRFLCQDDQLEPSCVQEEAAFFKSHPEVPMSFCKAIGVDQHGTQVASDELDDLPEVMTPSLTWQQFLYHGCIPGNLSTVCARRDAVDRVGGFDASFALAGDYDLWVRICSDRPLGVVRKHLVRLRRHRDQLGRAHPAGVGFVRENRRVQAALWTRVPQEARWRVWIYLRARYSAMDVHYLVMCLLRGRLTAAAEVARSLGFTHLATGLFFWVATLNNRLYRPRAPFHLGPSGSTARP